MSFLQCLWTNPSPLHFLLLPQNEYFRSLQVHFSQWRLCKYFILGPVKNQKELSKHLKVVSNKNIIPFAVYANTEFMLINILIFGLKILVRYYLEYISHHIVFLNKITKCSLLNFMSLYFSKIIF